MKNIADRKTENKRILLAILPYWDPMIPPMGITTIKAFLQEHGYTVRTVDLIVKKESLDFYGDYFDTLKKCVPVEKRGNFNNIGHDVLQCHMMAHQDPPRIPGTDQTDEEKYIQLVKILIHSIYYVHVDDARVRELIKIMDDFYVMLEKYFLQLLEEEKPDVLGVTAYKCTVPASLFVLKLAKEKYPHIETLMGGGTFNESHAPDSPNFQALLDAPYLDKIMLGPGELLLLAYLQGKLDPSKRVYTKEDVNGRILPFDQQILPDFSDLDMEKYPYLAATASASCLFDCSFCVTRRVSGKYREKDARQTVAEMIKMYKQYGHQLFFMTDSMLNSAVSKVAHEFIKSGVSLYYDAYFRVDEPSGDIRNTLLWRKGGLYRVRLGTESGSQRILDAMGKNITVEQIKASVSAFAHAGIKTTTYWVIGHPGETEEDFQQTLDLIEELKDDIYQAESNYFLLHYSKQASEGDWRSHTQFLYPQWVMDSLLFQYYTPGPGMPPLREETFDRMHRFEAHCRKFGISNPYSYDQHAKAEERWKRLHPNAVPSMMDFLKKDEYIDENLKVETADFARNTRENDDDDFNF
jgi:hypothetical protein